MLDRDSLEALRADAAGAHLSDARLRARLVSMTMKLAADPSLSFPRVFDSAELEGAYRFFGNALVTPDGILGAHIDSTRRQSEEAKAVLVLHDSSTFAFDPHGAREGLGRVRSEGQAFFAHVSLVLTDDGKRRPLGLAALHTWVRAEPGAKNEKTRWYEAIARSTERLDTSAHVVHVMDREADDYALFLKLVEGRHHFVVRLARDRLLQTQEPADPRSMEQAMARIECVVQREARLAKRIEGYRSPKQKAAHPSRGARQATLSVGWCSVTLKRPAPQPKSLAPSLPLHVVRVWEEAPPVGEEPVEWILITDERIDSPKTALLVVDRYRARWTIEEYFKALKTGCAFPDRQLGDYEGLVNALAVFAPIACRLLALRTQARDDRDSPASLVLDPDEIEVLRALGRLPLPPNPSARDALLAVAALGGHIRWAGDPGWLTLGRGFAALETLTRGWRAAKMPP